MQPNEIRNALKATRKHLPTHYKTLFGERAAGSQWGFELTPEHLHGDWMQILAEPVQIWQMESHLQFENKCWTIAEVAAFTDVKDVYVFEGKHGPELRTNVMVGSVTTNTITIIIGKEESIEMNQDQIKAETLEVVYTIHPGDPMSPIQAKTVEELQEQLNNANLDPNTAVKYVEKSY